MCGVPLLGVDETRRRNPDTDSDTNPRNKQPQGHADGKVARKDRQDRNLNFEKRREENLNDPPEIAKEAKKKTHISRFLGSPGLEQRPPGGAVLQGARRTKKKTLGRSPRLN